jgi:hypothetical protein
MFQAMAPIRAARITYSETKFGVTNPIPIVLATWWPVNRNAAAKLKKAAHTTALRGVRTRVETIVAIEFAAS